VVIPKLNLRGAGARDVAGEAASAPLRGGSGSGNIRDAGVAGDAVAARTRLTVRPTEAQRVPPGSVARDAGDAGVILEHTDSVPGRRPVRMQLEVEWSDDTATTHAALLAPGQEPQQEGERPPMQEERGREEEPEDDWVVIGDEEVEHLKAADVSRRHTAQGNSEAEHHPIPSLCLDRLLRAQPPSVCAPY